MPFEYAVRRILSGNISAVAGGDTDPPPDPIPPSIPVVPPMPTTSKDGTWSLQWSQDFNIPVAAGQFLSAYGGTPAANDIGKGQFRAYTYGASYKGGYTDTRSKHTNLSGSTPQPFNIATTAGSPNIIADRSIFGTSPVIDLCYLEATGVIPTETRMLSHSDTTHAVMNKNAIATTTTTAVVARSDFGYYDQNSYSVGSDSICKLRLYTDANGRHHVGALGPKVNNTTSTYNTLGGRFSLCMRIQNPLATYKVAHLLWPQSNTSNPDGEIDMPEMNLDGLDTISMFEHWQGAGGQSSGSSPIDIVGTTNWTTVVIEWRPNPANTALATLKGYAAQYDSTGAIATGSLTTPFASFTGVKVPNTPMHWVWQTETFLSYSLPIGAADDYVEYAWSTYENMI